MGSHREGVPPRDSRGQRLTRRHVPGRSQLLVHHFMFGPEYSAGGPACSAIADGFNGFAVHLANHDVMCWAVSRAPLPKLSAEKNRMGWSFPWASSYGTDFNSDFQVGYTEAQQESGIGEYNYRTLDQNASAEAGDKGPRADWAATTGTDWRHTRRTRAA